MWGSWNFYKMYQRQGRLIAEEVQRRSDVEFGIETTGEPKDAVESRESVESGEASETSQSKSSVKFTP